MKPNVEAEVAALEHLSMTDLVAKYAEVFGEHTRSRQRLHLTRRIAWRMQSLAEGDLSERARKRAAELARTADVRQTPPRTPEVESAHVIRVKCRVEPRLPDAGGQLIRRFKGHDHIVTVLNDGFQYEGKRYKSLSAVAQAITGQHTSGFAFFRLGSR